MKNKYLEVVLAASSMQSLMTFTLLTLSAVGSLFTAAATVLVLNPEDRISIWRGAALTALGYVFFLSLFDLLNHAVLGTGTGQRLRRQYRLTAGDVLDITNKVVSAVQAAFCCFTGAVVCLWSCTRDLLHSSHYMSEAYAWFGAAYFFYDIWSMYKVHIYMNSDDKDIKEKREMAEMKKMRGSGDATPPGDGDLKTKPKAKLSASFLAYCKNEPVILFHHLFIGGFGFLVIVYLRGGLGDCVFGFVYLMELSTPFVSARGILSRMGLKTSRLYVANGLAMLLSFFFCRILSLPYVLYMYSSAVSLTYFQAWQSLPAGCKVSIGILLLPQIYWFYLMSAGALKVFFPSGKSKPSINNNTRRHS